jgi:hypothetical protein
MQQVEPFVEFLARTSKARPEEYSEAIHASAIQHGLSNAKVISEFQRMKGYILSYYEGVSPLCSFLNLDGITFDCVPTEQQPTYRAARDAGYQVDVKPPKPAPFVGISTPTDTAQESSVPSSGISSPPGSTVSSSMPSPFSTSSPSCVPQGTVALRRISLENLISFGTLDNFFHKTHGTTPL